MTIKIVADDKVFVTDELRGVINCLKGGNKGAAANFVVSRMISWTYKGKQIEKKPTSTLCISLANDVLAAFIRGRTTDLMPVFSYCIKAMVELGCPLDHANGYMMSWLRQKYKLAA